MKLKDYYRAQTIDEVVSLLNQSKKNIILGGSHWLGLGNGTYNLGIDISCLGLDQIVETDTAIEIGAHVSLRQLETNDVIENYAHILKEAVSGIVGVQFRNTARIGASVYSRFGFSDVTASLLTMDTHVEVDGEETMPLSVYMVMPKQRHFLTKIIIRKEKLSFNYQTIRQDKTALPYLIMAMSKTQNNEWRISIGARPSRATLAHKTMHYLNHEGMDTDKAFALLQSDVALTGNLYASEAFRTHLAQVFLERGVKALWN